ncbi:MAG: hypothetical protein JRC89_01415 [Deltaproteobacteria bacterium]|nr:hypothetical protein [Deltaproteobacteria bacterium]
MPHPNKSERLLQGRHDKSNQIFLNTGGRYDPSTDSWQETSSIEAPEGRDGHTAFWTGNEMIVWSVTGCRYIQ